MAKNINVRVEADTTQAVADIKGYEAWVEKQKANVTIGALTADAMAKVKLFEKAVSSDTAQMKVGVNTALADAKMAAMNALADKLRTKLGDIKVGKVGTVGDLVSNTARDHLATLIEQMRELSDAVDTVDSHPIKNLIDEAANGQVGDVLAKLRDLSDHMDTADSHPIKDLIDSAAAEGVKNADESLKTLTGREGEATTAAYGLAKAVEGIAQRAHELEIIKPFGDKFVFNNQDAEELDVLYKKLVEVSNASKLVEGSLSDMAVKTDQAGAKAATAGRAAVAATGGWGGWGLAITALASIDIPLFSTSMTKAEGVISKALDGMLPHWAAWATGVHMGIEAVVEFVAIWGPASVAMTAFGALAYDTAKKVYGQFTNMNTMANATGASFKGLKGTVSDLQDAIRPQVMQLYGDYLTLSGNSADHFGQVMQDVGKVLDNFGAKIAMAMNSKTASTFLHNAASDINGLGVAFTQVGRIIGDLLKDVPGYAEMLLKLGDAALTAAADLVHFANPAIALFLKLHGAIFYLGLGATVLGTFGKSAVNAFKSVATTGEKATEATGKIATWGQSLGNMSGLLVDGGKKALDYSKNVVSVGKEAGVAKAATTVFGDAMAAIPFGPVGLGALAAGAAIGGILYLALHKTTDAADKLNVQMEKQITNSNLANIQSNIASAIDQTTKAIDQETQSQVKLTGQAHLTSKAVMQLGPSLTNPVTGGLSLMGQQVENNTSLIDKNRASIAQYVSQSQNAAVRTAGLAKQYGNVTSAMEMMNLAGVKQSDVAKANGKQWALDQQKIAATAQAYGFMGEQAGTAGRQLDTLNIATGDNTKAVQTLTQAEQQWLTIITGGDSAMATFINGNKTLAQSLTGGAANAVKFTASAGKLTQQIKLVGGSLKGTSQSALANRQAFDAQITAGGQLYGNLQMLAAASGNTSKSQQQLAQAGKDVIAQLLPFAAHSKTATAELYGLAQVTGYNGVDSFQGLSKWVGNTTHSEADLNTQTQNLTVSSANLTTAAKNLGNAIQADITASQAQAIIQSKGFQKAQQSLINTLQQSNGQITQNALLQAGQYYNSLIKVGLGNQQATQYTDALLKSMGVAPQTINSVNNVLNTLNGKTSQTKSQFEQFAGKLGLTKTQADAVYGSLQKLNVTVNPKVNESVSGSGSIKLTSSLPGVGIYTSGAAQQAQQGPGSPQGFVNQLKPKHARGGVIGGASSSVTSDNMLASVKSGELIIPSQHAPKFADMARKAGIPGFSSGGVVNTGPASLPGITAMTNAVLPTTQVLAENVVKAATLGLINQAQQAAASIGGPGGGPLGGATGSSMANGRELYLYLLQNVFGGSKIAAAGATASIWGESAWNPFAVGTGGRGLIGWTPEGTISDAAFRGGMATQLPAIIKFISSSGDWGVINAMKSASSVSQAAWMWGRGVERFGIPDVHSTGIALATSIMNSVSSGANNSGTQGLANTLGKLSQVKPHSGGGTISEPVFGVGLRSGIPYSFAEKGPEQVISASQAKAMSSGHPGDPINRAQMNELIAEVKRGNQIAAGQPQQMARYAQSANAAARAWGTGSGVGF